MKRKTNKRKRKEVNPWESRFMGLLMIVIVVVLMVLVYSGIKQIEWNEQDKEFDLDFSAPELMDLMEESNIKIYGHYGCIWCLRQIISFNKTLEEELKLQQNVSTAEIIPILKQQDLVTRGLFVDCQEDGNQEECAFVGVTSTPAWAKDNVIFRTGFVPIG